MKKSNSILLILFGTAVFLAVAGMIYVRFFGVAPFEVIEGNKQPATEKLDLQGFTKIAIRSDVEVSLEQGDFEVRLEGESNLLPYLMVEKGNTGLTISRKKGFRLKTHEKLRVFVRLPALEALDIKGAGKVRSESTLRGDALRLDMNGAPQAELMLDYERYECTLNGAPAATLTGKGGNLSLVMNGAGNFHAENLECRSADIKGNGAVSVRVHASERLEVELNGASDLRYRGNPEDVRSKLNGASTMDSMK